MAKTPRKPRQETPRKRPGGERNSRYSQALAARICARLAEGGMWGEICKEPGMPAYATFYVWQKTYPEFAEAVEAAREAAADYCADRALAVAAAATKETVPQDRLHVSTLLKRAEKAERASAKVKPAARPEPLEIVFRVRHFERVVGPDGKAFVREIKPEGQA